MNLSPIYEKLSENIDHANAHWAAFPVFGFGFAVGLSLGDSDLAVAFLLLVILFVQLSKNNVDRRHRKAAQAKLDELLDHIPPPKADLVGLENAPENEIDQVKREMVSSTNGDQVE